MTFDELNQHQEIKHEREVSMEKEKKKQDKKRLIASETIYGVSNVTRSANKTVRQVKRLQHDSKLLGKVTIGRVNVTIRKKCNSVI